MTNLYGNDIEQITEFVGVRKTTQRTIRVVTRKT